MSRRLVAALVALCGLTAIVTAALGPHRERLEDDLTRRATVALAAAGQPDAHVTFTGRDGLVVTSASASARARDVVAAIDGVRTVRTRVVAGQSIPGHSVPGQAVPDRTPPLVLAVTEHVRAAMAGAAGRIRLQRDLAAGPALVFTTGGAELTAKSRAALRDAARLLVAHPDVRIRVEGHTDSRGARQTNLALSRERADAVRTALTELGVPADRMTVTGYGEARPRAANDTVAHRAQNRRVELTVL